MAWVARDSARFCMKGWVMGAPAPWARTRRNFGFLGVRRRAETSLPWVDSKRSGFAVGISGEFSRILSGERFNTESTENCEG